jgi:hypothetical protein
MSVTPGTRVAVIDVRPLFDVATNGAWPYDVSRNGQRFLIKTVVEDADASPLTVVVNWWQALARRPTL